MLTHPTVDAPPSFVPRHGQGAERTARIATGPEPAFEERLGLLVDREITERSLPTAHQRLRLREAPPRRLHRGHRLPTTAWTGQDLVLSLADGRYRSASTSTSSSTGPAGVGKTWIACALAHSACRNGHSASYRRLSRLLTELAIARADGRYPKLLASIADRGVLVIDDWGWPSSTPRTAATCSKSSRTVMALTLNRRDQPAPPAGMTSIGSRPWPTPSSTDLVHSTYQLQLEGRIDAKTTISVDPARWRLAVRVRSLRSDWCPGDRNRCPSLHREPVIRPTECGH